MTRRTSGPPRLELRSDRAIERPPGRAYRKSPDGAGLILRRVLRFTTPVTMPRLPLCLAAALLAGLLPARAANVGPELFQPLPALTLAPGAAPAPIPLTQHLRDPDVPGSAVRITVRIGHTQSGVIDIALHDAQAPLTVANFLAYVADGRYAANFIHRSVPGFIIQNGGFRFLNDTTFDLVPAFPAVLNEPGASNLRGTLAMAKLGNNPDSATNQWFINLANNSANLDAQNGGFTVFAHVLGNGMAVADAIAAIPRFNVSNVHPAWTDIPLTTASLQRQFFIETNAARIAPLAFTATSDAPALVAATLAHGVLSLAPSSTLAGTTTIRLTATDLEGSSLQTAFNVTVHNPNLLSEWRQIHFATSANAGPAANLADPDGDGVSNLLEYALGGDPASPASRPLPLLAQLPAPDSRLALTYVRSRPDVIYEVQTTTDLAAPASWSATGVTQGTPDAAGLTTATIPATGPTPRFLRLSVTLAP